MRFLPLLLAWTVVAQAQDSLPAPVPEPTVSQEKGFRFQLLPNVFTSKPRIGMTVYSERTVHGRTLPDVTPENPVYYVAQSLGFQAAGSSPVGVTPPSAEKVELLLRSVLEKRGYRFASDLTRPPALALTYYWGVHGAIPLSDVIDNPEWANRRAQDLLQRAKLVGGNAYASQIARELEFGVFPGDRSTRDEYLRYQVQNDIYYVVVSAYDFNLLAQGKRQLVWRTTMTVNDQGVNMQETIPPLIASAVDYFGRDTDEPVALQRTISRGSVTLGPLIIIGEAPATEDSGKSK